MAAAVSRLIAARMTEAELQEQVRQMCGHLGLVVRHVRDERGNWVQGWPDLDILGKRLIHRELKSQHGRLTADQRRIGSLINRAEGLDWSVWRPADLVNGTIARQLAAIA